MSLSNEEYFRFINQLDDRTLEGVVFLLKEQRENLTKKFLTCDSEKDLFKLQGSISSYEEMIKKIERIKEDKIKEKIKYQNSI